MKISKSLCVIAVALIGVLGVTLVGCAGSAVGLLPESTYITLRGEDNMRTEGTDIRVMSYNLLVEAWAGDDNLVSETLGSDTRYRASMFGEVLHHYQPDVVALQEVDEKWHKYLKGDLLGSYEMIFDKGSEYTTMMYNTDTVELIDEGKRLYAERTDKRMRYLCWGVFEIKESGREIIVTNTHLDLGNNKAKQDAQAVEIATIVAEIENAHPEATLFMAGDFNAYEPNGENGVVYPDPEYGGHASDVYTTIVNGAKVVDSKFEAINRMWGDAKTYTDYTDEELDGVDWYWEHPSWDHIFIRAEQTEALTFRLLSNRMYKSISDHFPIVLDAKIVA